MHQMEDDTITEALADFCTKLRYEDLPPEIAWWGRAGFLDTLGAAICGSADMSSELVRVHGVGTNSSGPCTVVGTTLTAIPAAAALANGYAAHVHDYDDTQYQVGVHMSASVGPAALAAGEAVNASGPDLIAAYVAGFDVGCRLGRAGKFARHLSHQGIHATGYLGHFGSAAAAGRLAGLTPAQMKVAFGISASGAFGIMKAIGTMGKSQSTGNAAHHAVMAAFLAKDGFTAPTQMFDGEENIFTVCGLTTDPDELLADLGVRFELSTNVQKVYACAGWRNSIVEASSYLAANPALVPADIERVDLWAPEANIAHLPNYSEPVSGVEAKFSSQYTAAIGLIDRAGGMAQFSDKRARDPEVTALSRRVHQWFDPELKPFHMRMRVQMMDGQVFTHAIDHQKGHHENPMTWDELAAKFHANSAPILGSDNTERIIGYIAEPETLSDVSLLGRLCRPGP